MNFVKDTEGIKKVLLVQPNFPIAKRQTKNYFPIGLLKIGKYFQEQNADVRYIDLKEDNEIDFDPDIIFITSIFTYWCDHIKDAVDFCKENFNGIRTVVGGIYASLMPEHCKEYTKCDDVYVGLIDEVEDLEPAYELVDSDLDVIHTSRGCVRRCDFCGVYQIEPKFKYKHHLGGVKSKRVIFYDNNLLANPHIDNILDDLYMLKLDKKINYVESQSGFDGRILQKKPHLAKKLKITGFKHPRIAWDNGFEELDDIKEQIGILIDAGFDKRLISVFILVNYVEPFDVIEAKRVELAKLGVQIVLCRYIPLNQTYDNYKPRRKQTCGDYYIHPNWTDAEIKQIFRNQRKHNMSIRFGKNWYSKTMEQKKLPRELHEKITKMSYDEAKHYLNDIWSLYDFHRE